MFANFVYPFYFNLKLFTALIAVEGVAAKMMGQLAQPILTRQALPTLDRSKFACASGLRKGGYVLSDATNGKPDVLLIATGSEVSLCVDAQAALKQQGVEAQVISMPSWERFEQQDEHYPKPL